MTKQHVILFFLPFILVAVGVVLTAVAAYFMRDERPSDEDIIKAYIDKFAKDNEEQINKLAAEND